MEWLVQYMWLACSGTNSTVHPIGLGYLDPIAQGIHNDADGNDGPHERTNVVCRSHDEALLAVGTANDVSGSIKIFSCPALQHSKADIYRAHSSCVNDVCFTHSDKHIVSCGGFNDSSIVLWNVVRY